MLLIVFLLVDSFAESISLTSENYDSIKDQAKGKPLLLELWDPWCNHCTAFRPKWNQLSNSSKHINRIIFSDINCVENKILCKKISKSGYPQVVFFDPLRNSFIEYDGPMDIEDIESFINKQINFPIIILDDESELIKYRQKTNISSLFVLVTNEKINDNQTQLVKEAASNYRNASTIFVSLRSLSKEKERIEGKIENDEKKGNNPIFFVYRSFDHKINYDGDWSQSSLNTFVQTNFMPILPPITGTLFDDFKISKQMCVVAFIESSEQYDQILSIAENLNSSFQTYYTKYEKNDYFCRFVGVEKEKLPQLVVLDVARERWSFYRDQLTSGNVEKWLKKFTDAKNIKWGGPGIGAFSDIYSTFYTLYANGGYPFYIVICCFIFILFAIVYIIYDAINLFREDDERKNV